MKEMIFFYRNKRKILKMAGNEELLKKYPTKRNIKSHEISVKITVKKESVDFKRLTIDHIDSFKKVKNVSFSTNTRAIPIAEEIFKKGLQRVIGEEGKFTDWGGELDDLYTNRIMLEEKRITVAFGLKGKGKMGKLTPKLMGVQGDQIQRLFRSPADAFFVQYWAQIDESIIEQMEQFAIAKSALEGRRIYYGIIDGQDTIRLMKAYPECFENIEL